MSDVPFDPNHAPAGYIAVLPTARGITCPNCALHGVAPCASAPCLPGSRPDRCLVYFVARPDARAVIHTALVKAGLVCR